MWCIWLCQIKKQPPKLTIRHSEEVDCKHHIQYALFTLIPPSKCLHLCSFWLILLRKLTIHFFKTNASLRTLISVSFRKSSPMWFPNPLLRHIFRCWGIIMATFGWEESAYLTVSLAELILCSILNSFHATPQGVQQIFSVWCNKNITVAIRQTSH